MAVNSPTDEKDDGLFREFKEFQVPIFLFCFN